MFVNDLALIVHHIVEAQQVFANFEVAFFNFLLRFLQCFVDPGVDDGLALFQTKFLQHPVNALRSEDAHQIVLQRQEKFRTAGVSLTAGTTTQLIIDASCLVAFGADDIQPAAL